MKYRVYIQMTSESIVKNTVFEYFIIMVIIANSISLATYNPLSSFTPYSETVAENVYLAIYSIEMIFKIFGFGFMLNKGAYLRDPWNILDFSIVLIGYV